MSIIICIFLSFPTIWAIWPPAYNINLVDEETFIISDLGDDINFDDEMIKDNDLEKFHMKDYSKRFFRLHQLSKRKNKLIKDIKYKEKKVKEMEYENDLSYPWFGKSIKTFKGAKESEKHDEKRENLEANSNSTDDDYDYQLLQKEYQQQIEDYKQSPNAYNFTEVKEEDTIKEVVETAIGVDKIAVNCTLEEKKGIGMNAAKCLLTDLTSANKDPKQKAQLAQRLIRIVFIWFLMYLIVASCCWCQYGIGCCCFTFKACSPRETIDEAKRFFVNNPAGIYHTPDGKEIRYSPTSYEVYAQNNLEKALRKL